MQLLSKRNIIILGLGLALVLAVSGYSIYATLKKSLVSSNGDTLSVSAKNEPVYSDIKAEKTKLDSAKTDKDRVAAYVELSNLYANTKTEKSVAVVYAQKLVDLRRDSDSYGQLAFSYKQAGEYTKAIEAYKKAASLSENKVDDGRSGYSDYLQQAQALESEQK